MAFNLRNRSFVKEPDFTPHDLRFLLKLGQAENRMHTIKAAMVATLGD
jgi:ornithine carbamoyltransferase